MEWASGIDVGGTIQSYTLVFGGLVRIHLARTILALYGGNSVVCTLPTWLRCPALEWLKVGFRMHEHTLPFSLRLVLVACGYFRPSSGDMECVCVCVCAHSEKLIINAEAMYGRAN